MPVLKRIQARRGTSTAWASANPILAVGEQGYDITTKDFKIGDGTSTWNVLPYFSTKDGSDTFGTASNPVTSASSARPTGLTTVWWTTVTKPTNWQPGDIWIVSP